jgi:hypothetical protein
VKKIILLIIIVTSVFLLSGTSSSKKAETPVIRFTLGHFSSLEISSDLVNSLIYEIDTQSEDIASQCPELAYFPFFLQTARPEYQKYSN